MPKNTPPLNKGVSNTANHVDLLRLPSTTSQTPPKLPPRNKITSMPHEVKQFQPSAPEIHSIRTRLGCSSLRQQPKLITITQPINNRMVTPPTKIETPCVTLTPPVTRQTFGSQELLRDRSKSNSTTKLYVRPRPHTQVPPPKVYLDQSQSTSVDNVRTNLLRTPDLSLQRACRNVSNSNRSLVENIIKARDQNSSQETVGVVRNKSFKLSTKTNEINDINKNQDGSGSSMKSLNKSMGGTENKETQRVNVERLPGSTKDAPVFVFDDSPPEKPSLLQRSKTFFVNRAESVRQSFRSRTNSSNSKPNKRISLVFGNNEEDSFGSAPADLKANSKPKKAVERRNSFKAIRKRLFT